MKKNVVVQAGAALFVLVTVFCSLVLGGSIGYYVLPYSNGNKFKEKSSVVEEVGNVELPVDNQLVQLLYAVPMSSALEHNAQYADYLYQRDKVTISDFSNSMLLAMAYSHKNIMPSVSENGSFITSNDLKETYNELFGGFASAFSNVDFQLGCTSLHYSASDDTYRLFENNCAAFATSDRINQIVKAVKTEDAIEIYDLVAYVDLENQKIYSDSSMMNFVADYEGEANIKDYESDLNQYKYTFKLADDTNYYFYSSELVK